MSYKHRFRLIKIHMSVLRRVRNPAERLLKLLCPTIRMKNSGTDGCHLSVSLPDISVSGKISACSEMRTNKQVFGYFQLKGHKRDHKLVYHNLSASSFLLLMKHPITRSVTRFGAFVFALLYTKPTEKLMENSKLFGNAPK
jgi:hypothetical protein